MTSPDKRNDLSGALGDIGLLIPLSLALIAVNGLNPTFLFLGVGLAYIGAGWFFKIPMPVQPLKALSVLAIAQGLGTTTIQAAALIMGLLLLLLSLNGVADKLARLFPVPVIKGIQLSLGLLLIKVALDMIIKGKNLSLSVPALFNPSFSWYWGVLIALISLILIFLLQKFHKIPVGVVLVFLGVIVGAIFYKNNPNFPPFSLGFVPFTWSYPHFNDFLLGFWALVIPQLPLTLGNAVVSTAYVAKEYYQEQAERVTPTNLCRSMGLTNLFIGLMGGMPVCHGAGGLTAHYRFGARTPRANYIIGGLCIILALFFGRSLTPLLSYLPLALLGAMIGYIGFRHILLVGRLREKSDYLVILTVALVTMIFKGNLVWGALAGILVYSLLKLLFPQKDPLKQKI
jgi:SulP family sulfate permease